MFPIFDATKARSIEGKSCTDTERYQKTNHRVEKICDQSLSGCMCVFTLWHQGIDRYINHHLASKSSTNLSKSKRSNSLRRSNRKEQSWIEEKGGVAQNFLEGCVTDIDASASGTGFVPHCGHQFEQLSSKKPCKISKESRQKNEIGKTDSREAIESCNRNTERNGGSITWFGSGRRLMKAAVRAVHLIGSGMGNPRSWQASAIGLPQLQERITEQWA